MAALGTPEAMAAPGAQEPRAASGAAKIELLPQADAEKLKVLDTHIVDVLSRVGMPTWLNRGGGGDRPQGTEFDVAVHPLLQRARLDFQRRVAKDEWRNIVWQEMANRLPLYRQWLENPTSGRGIGNAMESVVGIAAIAYACHSNFPRFEVNERLEWAGVEPEVGKRAWAALWPVFTDAGVTATPTEPLPLGGWPLARRSPSREPAKAPATPPPALSPTAGPEIPTGIASEPAAPGARTTTTPQGSVARERGPQLPEVPPEELSVRAPSPPPAPPPPMERPPRHAPREAWEQMERRLYTTKCRKRKFRF